MGSNKLLQEWRGQPLLRWVVEAALKSEARPVTVVTGNDQARIEAALQGLDVSFAHNPSYPEGLSTSLKAGITAVPVSADGALVLLGDMPEIDAPLIDRMIAAFSPADGRSICVAMHEHKRGNPVLLAKDFFPEIAKLTGDIGAKSLLAANEDVVCEIEAGGAALRDIDTPEALQALRAESEAPV
jgi:molybdenum cofactor cytidylyltransferase